MDDGNALQLNNPTHQIRVMNKAKVGYGHDMLPVCRRL